MVSTPRIVSAYAAELTVQDGVQTVSAWELPPGCEAITAALAGAIPASPPAVWFSRDDVPDGSPLTFQDNGRVYGLLAPKGVPHIGHHGRRVVAPTSRSGYGYFHTGQVRCADGTRVSTGRITMLTGHMPSLTADARTAAAHYDNTGTAVADVIAWDSPAGVMCAGAARPGLTAEHIRMAMASPASGDWRPMPSGDHEMVGALLVNVPGFPVVRPPEPATYPRQEGMLVASGAPEEPGAIIASAGTPPIIVTSTEPREGTVTAPQTPDTPDDALEPFGDDLEVGAAVQLDTARVPHGLVASVADGYATVELVVPVDALTDTGTAGRALLASAQQSRARDLDVDRRITGLMTAIEGERAARLDAEAAASLAAIPAPEA